VDDFGRRDIPAYLTMVLKAVGQARVSLSRRKVGGLVESGTRAVSSGFFATLQQLRHRGLGIASHPGADAFPKAVVFTRSSSADSATSVPMRTSIIARAGERG
jgi:hypothetical protein